MASLTRKFLEGLGIESDKVELIIDAHTEVVSEIKDERDKLKASAQDTEGLKAENEALKQERDELKEKADAHDTIKAEFDEYKQQQEAAATAAAKTEQYKELLKEANVGEKYIDLIIKGADLSKVELEDGKIKDADKLSASLKEEFKAYIESSSEDGVGTSTPPAGGEQKPLEELSMEDYIKARKTK